MRFSHPHFKIFRLDRTPEDKGGVAIVIARNIKHLDLKLPKLKVIEAIGISIPTKLGCINIISIYNPPGLILTLKVFVMTSDL